MKKNLLSSLILIMALMTPFTVLAKKKYLSGVYTIGGLNPNYTRIQDAILDVSNDSSFVVGRVTFNIRAGVYNETLTMLPFNGASPKNFVIFKSETNNAKDVIIESNGGNTLYDHHVIRFEGAKYITLQDLTIRNKKVITNTNDYASCIHLTFDRDSLQPAEFNTINHCTLLLDSTYTVSNSQAIAVVSSDRNNMFGVSNCANFNTISNNTIVGGCFGIKLYGKDASRHAKGNKIIGNTMRKVFNGIHIDLNDIPIISNNKITMRIDPVKAQYGIHLKNANGNCNITGNVIENYGTFGLFFYNVIGGAKTYVYNNVITGSCKAAYSRAIHVEVSSNLQFYYNSLNYTGTAGTDKGAMAIEAGCTKIAVKNNIFVASGGAVPFIVKATTNLDTCNYNDYYSSGPNIANLNGANKANIAALRLTTAKDQQSLSVNPNFASATNLHMNSKQLIRKAFILPFVLVDFEGHPRDPEMPDIGADEVIKSDVDLEVFGLDKNFVPKTGPNVLPVIIKNDGLKSLNHPSRKVNIQYKVDNGPWVNTTDSFILSTLAASYSKQIFNLALPWDILNPASYVLRIRARGVQPTPELVVPSDFNTENDSIRLDICVGLNGMYTIGGTPGPSNYPTFTAALAAFGCGVGGPTVFNVRPGTYNEQITIPIIKGASSVNTVTFQSETGIASDVIINNAPAGNTANHHVFQVNGGDWVIFNNLTINNTSAGAYATGIHLTNGADHVTIKNCKITVPNATAINQFRFGIASSYQTKLDSPYKYGNQTDIINNTIIGGSAGVYFQGLSSSDRASGINIIGNTVDSSYLYGIYTKDVNVTAIQTNKVRLKDAASVASYGIRVIGSKSDALIQANKIYAAGLRGIELNGVEGINTVTLSSNMIGGGFKTSPSTGAGIFLNEVNKINVYNNSVYYDKNAISASAFYLSSGANVSLLNNIFYNPGGGYASYVASQTALRASDYNCFYTDNDPNSGQFVYWGVPALDLVSLRTTMGGSYEQKSIEADPMFTSVSDLHTVNPALDGKGLATPVVIKDFDLQTRNPYKPDIGADEFILSPVDMALISIDPIVFSTDSNIIKVKIANLGSTSLLNQPVILNWSSDGGNTWSPDEPFNALSKIDTSYSDTVYRFHKKFQGVINNTYNFFVRIKPMGVPSDGVPANDQISNVICVGLKAGTYTVGGASPTYNTLADATNAIACGVTGPVIFNVRSGTYNEQIRIYNPKNTSAVNTITFRSETGNPDNVTIKAGYINKVLSHVIRLDRAKYVNIENMTLMNSNATLFSGGSCIQITNQSDHITIRGNKLYMDSTATNPALFCIATSDSTDVIKGGKGGTNILIDNNTMVGGSSGIYLQGTSQFQRDAGFVITNNKIRQCQNSGISSNKVDINVIHKNVISMRTGTTASTGINIIVARDDIKITNNRVFNAASVGLSISDVISFGRSMIVNNMIGGGFRQNSNGIGITLDKVQYLNMYFNSVFYDGNSLNGVGLKIDAESRHLNIVNNAIGNSGEGLAVIMGDQISIDTSDYNDLYTKGNTFGRLAGTDYLTLEELKTATALDENSISIDPDFFSATNLKVSNPFLDQTGITIPGITTDIFDSVRNPLFPDIGANEFKINGNVRLLSIDEPLPSPEDYPGNIGVKVSIVNIGNSKLSGLSIKYFIDGIEEAAEAIPTPILPSETLEYLFPDSIRPLITNSYLLKVVVDLPGDIDPLDNTLSMTYNSTVSEVNDASIPSFDSPETYVKNYTPVRVWIKNLGTVKILTIGVNFSITNDTTYTGIVSGQYISTTGGILPNDSDYYEFVPQLIPDRKIRKLTAWVSDLQDDIRAYNDTAKTNLSGFFGVWPIPLGVSNEEKSAIFEVNNPWPNPANSLFHVNVNLLEPGDVTIRLTDMLGRVVKQEKYRNVGLGETQFSLSLDRVPAGVYHTSILFNDQVITKKLVVQK